MKTLALCLLLLPMLFHGQNPDSARISGMVNIINDIIDNGDYKQAFIKADSLYQFSKSIHNQSGVAEAYNIKGIINRDQSNLKAGLDYFLDALRIFEELKLPVRIAGCQNNVGLIYAEIGEYKTALSYYFKAEKINLKLDKKSSLAINYNNIATCYQKLQQYTSAAIYLHKSLNLRQAVNDSIGIAMSYHNMGLNYQLTGQQDSAIPLFERSLSYLKNFDENMGHAYNYLELGNSFLIKKDYVKAEPYLKRSLAICERNNLGGIRLEVYRHLFELYKARGDYRQAFEYQDSYLSAKELLEGEENKNEIVKKELEYDFNRRQELQKLESANKQAIAGEQIKNQRRLITYAIVALCMLSGLILIIFRSYNQKRKANFIITKQKEIVEHKNKEIVDSINYAKYIQNAILPTERDIMATQLDCFVMFKPKDIVSGDFYWIHKTQEQGEDVILVAVADCTGHGVPGALVSVVGNNGLNRCVREFNITSPARILDKLSVLVEETFEHSENKLKDGMDISLGAYHPRTRMLEWAGANNPLWIIREGALTEVKADKQPVGKYISRHPFTPHHIQLQAGDQVFFFTDGYPDQFGGPKGKKFKYRALQELLVEYAGRPVQEQKQVLTDTFYAWKGNLEQVDDICIIGLKIA